MHISNDRRLMQLPIWKGRLTVAPLHGGLSNESYVVTDEAGKHVVRFGEDFPFHDVSRARELMTARAAHAAGFGPEVEYSEPGLVVSRYVESRTLDAGDIRADPVRIAQMLRRFHRTMPSHVSGSAYMFWVFHTIREYARLLKSARSRYEDSLPSHLALSEELEEAQEPLPIIFAHNDLLPANFLDDGSRLWLIDYEYAGFSTAMFDLAGVAANAEMTERETASLLEAYFEKAPDDATLRSHAAMQCAALLREAMWGMVSEIHLKAPGADYATYTATNLVRLETVVSDYREKYR